ncbi:MAG: MarR family transcriptional regulator [Kofleriaceae bacterium]
MGVAKSRRNPNEFLETFAKLKRTLSSLAQGAYAELEIGTSQAKFVRHIGAAGQISQAELARQTTTDPTLTGRIIGTLIERGWVKRDRSEEDRREYVLQLTAAGKRAQGQIEKAREALAARVLDRLDDKDIDEFDRIVDKIVSVFS